ncbi:FxsA family protein [Tabrizicola sp.]|uniref:FxsA family protein n=1 Tax=Tabrizicola sp. TaxID=2005166 RepID=UPI00286B0280|nr:FxsA family protein [Tabrizicola sp.]
MWLFLLILAIPLIEIGLFVEFGGAIGVWPTLAWVLISAILGIFILRRVATKGAVTLGADMAEMGNPLSPIAHRVLLVVAAVLLLLPGFLTDALGLLLLLKPVRTLLIALIARRLKLGPRPAGGAQGSPDVIEGEWLEVDENDPPRRDKPSEWTRH